MMLVKQGSMQRDDYRGKNHDCEKALSSKARKLSAFPRTDVSASEVPIIQKKVVVKEVTSEAAILKLSWQPGRVYDGRKTCK